MMKKLVAMVACLVMTLALVPTVAFSAAFDTADAAVNIVMPNDNGKTNGGSYTLGAGTDAEVTVYRDWRSTSMNPTQSLTPKYIMVHNTGTYVGDAVACAEIMAGCIEYDGGQLQRVAVLTDIRCQRRLTVSTIDAVRYSEGFLGTIG